MKGDVNMKKQYLEQLKELKELANETDLEHAHNKADNILTLILNDLGFTEIVEEYEKVGKWYA